MAKTKKRTIVVDGCNYGYRISADYSDLHHVRVAVWPEPRGDNRVAWVFVRFDTMEGGQPKEGLELRPVTPQLVAEIVRHLEQFGWPKAGDGRLDAFHFRRDESQLGTGVLEPVDDPDAQRREAESRKRNTIQGTCSLGRKVCQVCRAVSFEVSPNCPSCEATRWWQQRPGADSDRNIDCDNADASRKT